MARVTVEDCLARVPNRFHLILAAARRARQLSMGSAPFVPMDNHKVTVVALREIAEGKVDPKKLLQTTGDDQLISLEGHANEF